MGLTVHQLALRLGKHIGVVSLDPVDPANLSPLHGAGLRVGDGEELLACINGALQELWEATPKAVRVERLGEVGAVLPPTVSMEDLGSASDPGRQIPLSEGWEEAVLLPLALLRLSVHPAFVPQGGREEIARQARVARRLIKRGESPVCAGCMVTRFR